MPDKPKRGWYQFRLRTLLVATAFLSIACGYVVESAKNDTEIARLKAELGPAEQAVARAADADREKTRPKLWLDDDAARSIKLIGYEYPFVIRWQHGEVEGWFEVDEENGPKRYAVDSIKQFPPMPAKKWKAKDVSGTIVITLRREKMSDGPHTLTDTFQLQIGTDVMREYVGAGGGGTSWIADGTPLKIKMDPDPKFGPNAPGGRRLGGPLGGYDDNDPNVIVLKRFVGQKEIPWLKLKFVEK